MFKVFYTNLNTNYTAQYHAMLPERKAYMLIQGVGYINTKFQQS